MASNAFDVAGKVAIVTGSSRGLGQYFGRALASTGADLVITSRNAGSLQAFQKEIEAMGHHAFSRLNWTFATTAVFNGWSKPRTLTTAKSTSS